MRELTKDEIKARQIEILNYFKATCEELGLRYSLAYGTLLGAVRHGGYIPWDDDIDVCMPREDYDKFCDFIRGKSGKFVLFDIKSNDTYYQNFAKVVDTETVLVDVQTIKQVSGLGLNVDVFPFDNCPTDEKEYNKWLKKVRKLSKWKSFIVNKGFPVGNNIIKTTLRSLQKIISLSLGLRFWMQRLEKEIKKYNNASTERMTNISLYSIYKKSVPASWFNNLKEIKFEDEIYSCFSNTDEYLINLYGDYMTPPPEEQRVAPHGYTAYLKEKSEDNL